MSSVNIDNNVLVGNKTKNRYSTKRKKKLTFFILMMLPFLIQVAIFYFYINGSSIVMSFMEYEYIKDSSNRVLGLTRHFAWLDNFKHVFGIIFSPEEIGMFGVSFAMYAAILFGITPIVVIFSFYVYKNYFMSQFFRVMLFLPQIVSSVVWMQLYKTMLGPVYMQLSGATTNVFMEGADPSSVIVAIIFFIIWSGFGSNILLMSGAMSGIDESIVEASHLDGCTTIKEFFYITLPSVYPTITTFIVLDITNIFINTLQLYTFFGVDSPVKSVGYFMEIHMLQSQGLTSVTNNNEWLYYPQLSAMGLLITVTIVPLAIGVRKLMEKYGPSED